MIKYPNGDKKNIKQTKRNTSNLGMTLENDLDLTHEYYLEHKIAVIHKKPTPLQIVKVDYPARSKAKVVEAYYKTPSTTDYNGIYKGQYIDFDAKETGSKTSFPLQNIHSHQMEHLNAVSQQGGISFLIVHFKSQNKYFLLPFDVLQEFWEDKEKRNGRK